MEIEFTVVLVGQSLGFKFNIVEGEDRSEYFEIFEHIVYSLYLQKKFNFLMVTIFD